MLCPAVSDPEISSQVQFKPRPNSYDSCQECSLAHWLEVRMLVELAEREDRRPKPNVFDDSLLVTSD